MELYPSPGSDSEGLDFLNAMTCMHAMHRCGLLLQMSWSLSCVSVGPLPTASYVKIAEAVEMPFGIQTRWAQGTML